MKNGIPRLNGYVYQTWDLYGVISHLKFNFDKDKDFVLLATSKIILKKVI